MVLDLSKLDLLVIQIDSLHIGNDLVLVAALGIDRPSLSGPLAMLVGRPIAKHLCQLGL
jgi:putative transposase